MTVEATYLFYIVIILLGTGFVILADKYGERYRCLIKWGELHFTFHYVSVFFTFVSILITCIPLCIRTCSADLNAYYKIYQLKETGSYDALYFILCKLLNLFTTDAKIGIAIIAIITILPVYYVGYSLKNELHYPLFMFAYFTMLYFYSYNYVRMLLASSFIIWGYKYLYIAATEGQFCLKNQLKIIFFFVIASGIHFSALCVLGCFIGIQLFVKYRRVFLFLVICGVYLFFKHPLYFLSFVKNNRYLIYISDMGNVGEVVVGFGTIARILPILLILFYFKSKFKSVRSYNLFLYFALINVAFSMLGYYVDVASRISIVFFVYQNIFMVPSLVKTANINKNDKRILVLLFVCYCLLYFYLLSMNFKSMQIVPYTWLLGFDN